MLAAGNHIGNSDVSGLPTPQRAVANGSRNPLRRPLNTTVRLSSNSPGHLLAYTNGTTHTRRGNCPGQHLFRDNSRRRAFAQEIYPPHITDRPAYVCVNMFCKNHRDCFVFKNCDGWKRHMKEHETVWPCMPNGACEISGTGRSCVLCGSLNPNEIHLTGHAMRDCGDTSTKPRNFSRRMNLEKHLSQSHAVPPHRTRGLAETWRKTLGKKNFACGFCICIFSTLHDQLNHIDNDHFKKGQQITEWSATNVVRGLLLSPEVAKSFQTMLSMEPYAIARDLHWDKRSVEDLQRRLEIAEDTADTLASEAYQMLTCSLSQRDSYGDYASTGLPGTDVVGQSKAAIGALDASAVGMGIKIDHQMEDIDRGSEHPWSSGCYHVEAPSTSFSIPLYDWPTNPKDMSEVATIIEHQKRYDMVPRPFSPVRSSSRARSSSPHFASQTVSESRITGSSPTSAYNSSTTTPNWPVIPSSTLSSLHSTGACEELREKLRIYEGSSLEYETLGTLNFDLADLAELPGPEGVSFPLDSHDIGQIQQCSPREQLNPYYDDDFEPEHVKKVMQIDHHYPMEPLTCDPRDLVKKTR